MDEGINKEHCEQYTEIHDLMAINSCQRELRRKDTLLSDTAVILYRASSHTDVETRNIKFTLSAGTYSVDDFMQTLR